MVHVVCLIADPKRIPLSGPAVAILERALGGAARWLAPDEACELPVDDHDPAEIRVRIEAALSPSRRTTSSSCRPRGGARACW